MSRLVTPEQAASNNSFTSLGALDTPIRRVHLNGSVENSPSLSVLVRRPNGSSLPASPQLETPDESPRKRRRLSPDDEYTPVFDAMHNSPEPEHQESPGKDTRGDEEYDPSLDDSFPEFLPSDDINPPLHPEANNDPSFVESQASSLADVEFQLTQDDPGRLPAPPDTSFEREQANKQRILDDSLTEPESPTQDSNTLPPEVTDTRIPGGVLIPAKQAHPIAKRDMFNADAGPSTPCESSSLRRLRSHSHSRATRSPIPEPRAELAPAPRRSSRLRSASPAIPTSTLSPFSKSKPRLRQTRSASITSQVGSKSNTSGKGRGKRIGRLIIEPIVEVEGNDEPEPGDVNGERGFAIGSPLGGSSELKRRRGSSKSSGKSKSLVPNFYEYQSNLDSDDYPTPGRALEAQDRLSQQPSTHEHHSQQPSHSSPHESSSHSQEDLEQHEQDIEAALQARFARIVPPIHFDMDMNGPSGFSLGFGEEEDNKDGIRVEIGLGGGSVGGGGGGGMRVPDEGESEMQLISQAPYNYSSQ